jgi:DnaJ-class molecular chaperone
LTFEYFTKDTKNRNRKVRNTRKVTIEIPAGVSDGITLKSPGNGREASGGNPAGDLLITFNVTPDPYFQRKDDDILVDVPINFTEVILVVIINSFYSIFLSRRYWDVMWMYNHVLRVDGWDHFLKLLLT